MIFLSDHTGTAVIENENKNLLITNHSELNLHIQIYAYPSVRGWRWVERIRISWVSLNGKKVIFSER